jgi:hypothetical protein
MKKLLYTALITVVFTVFMSSCSEENYYETYDVDAISEFVVLKPSNWQYDANIPKMFATISNPNITQNVIDRGLVLVYMAEYGTTRNSWQLIPRTEIYFDKSDGSFDYSIEWGYWMEPGYLEIEYIHSKDFGLSPEFDVELKIVIITDFDSGIQNNYNFENYDEVVKNFNVQELKELK